MVERMQFLKKKVWRAHEKALAGTFLPPGSGLATPALNDKILQALNSGKIAGNICKKFF